MPPLRAVLDANVIISALIRADSAPGRIVRAAVEGTTVRLVTSDPLIEELRAAIEYPRLQRHLQSQLNLLLWVRLLRRLRLLRSRRLQLNLGLLLRPRSWLRIWLQLRPNKPNTLGSALPEVCSVPARS